MLKILDYRCLFKLVQTHGLFNVSLAIIIFPAWKKYVNLRTKTCRVNKERVPRYVIYNIYIFLKNNICISIDYIFL